MACQHSLLAGQYNAQLQTTMHDCIPRANLSSLAALTSIMHDVIVISCLCWSLHPSSCSKLHVQDRLNNGGSRVWPKSQQDCWSAYVKLSVVPPQLHVARCSHSYTLAHWKVDCDMSTGSASEQAFTQCQAELDCVIAFGLHTGLDGTQTVSWLAVKSSVQPAWSHAIILHSRLITHDKESASLLAMLKQTRALNLALSDTLSSAKLETDRRCQVHMRCECHWVALHVQGKTVLMHCAVKDPVCSLC